MYYRILSLFYVRPGDRRRDRKLIKPRVHIYICIYESTTKTYDLVLCGYVILARDIRPNRVLERCLIVRQVNVTRTALFARNNNNIITTLRENVQSVNTRRTSTALTIAGSAENVTFRNSSAYRFTNSLENR